MVKGKALNDNSTKFPVKALCNPVHEVIHLQEASADFVSYTTFMHPFRHMKTREYYFFKAEYSLVPERADISNDYPYR